MPRSAALIDKCDCCGADDGLLVPHFYDHNCPRCTQNRDAYNMVQLHLETLIAPILEEWRKHYAERGLTELQLNEVLENVGKLEQNPVMWTPAEKRVG